MRRAALALGLGLALVAGAVGLGGCASLGYYAQSVGGHLTLMAASRPVAEWLDDPATPEPLRQRLRAAQAIRAFAANRLHLPDNASYRRYAELGRPAAVWSVTAAPHDALRLKQWCYPLIGCAGYRGYYAEADAQALGQALRAEGWEVDVHAIPAYSTLGWMNWAGGDPLLSTFIHAPDGELARLVFHELAHQVVYVAGDTGFNESFATAVERLGVAAWLAQASEPQRLAYARHDARRRAFAALRRQTRAALQRIYEQNRSLALVPAQFNAMKSEAMAEFRHAYAQLKRDWAEAGAPFDGYDRWVASANNASFAIDAAYDAQVPAFEALFAREGGDWPRFLAAVRVLARQTPAQRAQALTALANVAPAGAAPANATPAGTASVVPAQPAARSSATRAM